MQLRKKRPEVIGTSNSNGRVAAVPTSRVIDIFVSRLHPMTTINEIKDCVDLVKGDNLVIDRGHCEKLKARYEHLYASFYIQLSVNSVDMKRALDLYMCGES